MLAIFYALTAVAVVLRVGSIAGSIPSTPPSLSFTSASNSQYVSLGF